MKLPIGDINAENAAMHAGHASEADINGHVDGWIKAHQAEFDKWVSDAMAAANKPTRHLVSATWCRHFPPSRPVVAKRAL